MLCSEVVRGVSGTLASHHSGMVMHMVLTGSGTVRIGDWIHPLTQDGYLLAQTSREQRVELSQADYVRIELPSEIVGSEVFCCALTPHDYDVNLAVARMVNSADRESAYGLMKALVSARDSQALGFFLDHQAPEVMVRAREQLLAGLGTDHSLANWAATHGYSPYHFQRWFKHSHGLTPTQYLIVERVRKACRELIISDRDVEQIAHNCGYSSPTSFASTFKRATRFTPSQFRFQGLRWRDSLAFFIH